MPRSSSSIGPYTTEAELSVFGTSVSVEDLGYGLQVETVVSGPVTCNFKAEPLFRLQLWDTGTDAQLEERISNNTDWTDEIVGDETEDTFTIRYTHNTTGTVVNVLVEVREAKGDVKLTPAFVLAGADLTYSGSRIRLQVRYQLDDPATSYALIPMNSGQVYPFPHMFQVDTAINYVAGFLDDDGAQVATQLGSMQFTYDWSQSSLTGLLVYADDPAFRGKQILHSGGDTIDSARRGFAFYPPNRRLAVGEPYSAPYGVVLRPIAGEWWDAAVYYRFAMQTIGLQSLNRGRIHEAGTAFSQIARDAKILSLIGVDYSDGYPNYDFAKARLFTERTVDYYGTADVLHLQYDNTANQFAEDWPDILPALADSVTELNALTAATGIQLGHYTFINVVSPTSTAYAVSSPPWSDLVAKKADGTIITFALAGGQIVASLALTGDDAIDELLDIWMQFLLSYDGTTGAYIDTLAGLPHLPDDHSPNNNPEDNGYGSDRRVHRGLMVRLRNSLRKERGEDCWFVSEHAAETTLDVIEVMSLYGYRPVPNPERYLPVFKTVYGQYVRTVTFEGPDPSAFWQQEGGIYPLMFWLYLVGFHQGNITNINALPMDNLAGSNGIHLPATYIGEEDYHSIRGAAQDTSGFLWHIRRLSVTCFDTLYQYLVTGQRLRPVQNAHDRYIADNGFNFKAVSESFVLTSKKASGFVDVVTDHLDRPLTGLSGLTPNPVDAFPVFASAWLSQDSDSLLFIVSNWKNEAVTFDLDETATSYPWLAGTKTYSLMDPEDGSLTTLAIQSNGISTQLSLDAYETVCIYVTGLTPVPTLIDANTLEVLSQALTDTLGRVIEDESGNVLTVA